MNDENLHTVTRLTRPSAKQNFAPPPLVVTVQVLSSNDTAHADPLRTVIITSGIGPLDVTASDGTATFSP
jgi:hypothetical protein